MSERRCAVCGVDISHRHNCSKYCEDCAESRHKECARKCRKRLMDERFQKGLCTVCGIRKPRPNKKLCQECTNKRRIYPEKYKRERVDQGLCLRCGKPREKNRLNFNCCFSCALKDTERHRIYCRGRKQNAED